MSDDRQRFEHLWDRHFEAVLGYALRRAPRDVAEEATSQTFLTAWRRLDAIPHDAELPWLLGTCRRVLANERRGERRGLALRARLVAEPAIGVPDPGEHVGHSLAVRHAFRSLSADDREVLALTAWDGLTPTEAAHIMGCSPARARSRLFRARRRLKRALDAGDTPADTAPDTCTDTPEEVR